MTLPRIAIVGNRGGTNVGGSLEEACKGVADAELIESRRSMEGPRLLRAFAWRYMGRRPVRLRAFGEEVVACCRRSRPEALLATGIAGLDAAALQGIGETGARRILYLTDDPWNPAHRANWFLKTLSQYDQIFTTKRATVADLEAASGSKVAFLPFAYDPRLCHAEPVSADDRASLDSDVMFAGGADRERVPYIHALSKAGFRIALFGSYWEQFAETRTETRGQADPETVRRAVLCAKVVLCIVRRANRDGHSMRTFEVPACGGCMLTEYTEEHAEIFGDEGRAVLYFRTIPEMVEKAQWLIRNPDDRARLAAAAHKLITGGGNTYRDRLLTMLNRPAVQPEYATVTSNSRSRG